MGQGDEIGGRVYAKPLRENSASFSLGRERVGIAGPMKVGAQAVIRTSESSYKQIGLIEQ